MNTRNPPWTIRCSLFQSDGNLPRKIKNVAFVKEKSEEDVFSEIPKRVIVTITRDMGPSEVRDYIRQAFNLDQHGGNLEVLMLGARDEEISASQHD